MTRSLADLARRLKRPARAAVLPRLLLMTDSRRLPDPVAAAQALPAGSGVVLRHYDAPDREGLAHRLVALGRRQRLTVLVAGDIALATRVGAAGVHLPEYLARRIAGSGRPARPWPGFLVTAAAHSASALVAAQRLGADAALVSPVFPTASHPSAQTLGVTGLARLSGWTSLPVYALGGITPETAARLQDVPLAGFAAVGAWLDRQ